MHPILQPVERLIYRLTGVDPAEERSWWRYVWAVVIFTSVGFLGLMVIFFTQQLLPFNPQHLPGLSWHLAFNTAWSFTCNADWQSYTGESDMSYFAQTIGLSVHQFLSGAVGLAVLVAIGSGIDGHFEDHRKFLGGSDPRAFFTS